MINNRKLVDLEQAIEILNRCANSFQVVTIGRLRGSLSAEILRDALDLIQKRHPLLNSRIVGGLDNLRFESGAIKIPLRIVKNDNLQWSEVVLEELNQKIESYDNLARAILICCEQSNISYLIVTLHHAIADGLSSVRLHSEILTYCGKIASGESIGEVVSLKALPPIQQLLPKSMHGFRGMVNKFNSLRRLKLELKKHKVETFDYHKPVPLEFRGCGMIHRQLDKELTQQLINLCRQEKTTVHGALSAAMLLATAKKISQDKKTVSLSCQSVVSLRKRLQPEISDENLGSLASFVDSYHKLDTNTFFWDLARDVKQQLEAGLKRNDIFSIVLIFKKMIEFIFAHPYAGALSVGISNIGKVNIPEDYGVFKLEEISFVASAAVSGPCLRATVSTFGGKMFLNFPFSVPTMNQDTIEEVADLAIAFLVDACAKEKVAYSFTK